MHQILCVPLMLKYITIGNKETKQSNYCCLIVKSYNKDIYPKRSGDDEEEEAEDEEGDPCVSMCLNLESEDVIEIWIPFDQSFEAAIIMWCSTRDNCVVHTMILKNIIISFG